MRESLIPDWKNPELIQNPYPFYEKLRSSQPVAFDADKRVWIVTSYDDSQKILKDPRFTCDRLSQFIGQYSQEHQIKLSFLFDAVKKLLIFRDGRGHEAIRTPLVRALMMQSQKSFGSLVDQELDRIMLSFGDGQEIDLLRDLAHPFPIAVICRIIGLPTEDAAKIKSWADAVTRFIDTSTDLLIAEKASYAIEQYLAYIRPVWESRRSGSQQIDLLSLLHKLGEELDILDENDLLINTLGLFLAGHETTTSLLANGITALLSHPEAWALIQADHSSINAAVEEMLRFDSPVQRVARAAKEDIVWNEGVTINKGQYVAVFLGAANRDASEFESPNTFSVQRPKNRHIAFGAGLHHCVGAQLARLEASAALRRLVSRFPRMHLVGSESPYISNLTFRCRSSVKVRLLS